MVTARDHFIILLQPIRYLPPAIVADPDFDRNHSRTPLIVQEYDLDLFGGFFSFFVHSV